MGAINRKIQTCIGADRYLKIQELIALRKNHEYKSLLRKNVIFKNVHKGQRCFVIGNGPSINKVNFDLLANEITFTVNQIPRNVNFAKLKTNYHCWTDEFFFDIDRNKKEDIELLNVMKSVNTDGNRPIVFYKLAALSMIKKYGLDKVLNIYYLGDAHAYIMNQNLKRLFDICHFLPQFSTVVQYVICIAVYMGFKEIYLLGCDCTGIITAVQSRLNSTNDYRYGYTISDNEKKRMISVHNQLSLKTEVIMYLDLLQSYEALDSYCSNRGTKLFNATEGSVMEGVRRVKINDIIHE